MTSEEMYSTEKVQSGLGFDFGAAQLFPWFGSFSDVAEFEPVSYSSRHSVTKLNSQTPFNRDIIGGICDEFDASSHPMPHSHFNPHLSEVKVGRPSISSFELTPIPTSEDQDSSFEVCVYYLQKSAVDCDPAAIREDSSDLSNHRQIVETMSSVFCVEIAPDGDLRVCDSGKRFTPEMLQREPPLKKLIRLCRAEVMTCVTPRSSTPIDTPLLQDDTPSLASSSDSASPRLRQRHTLYNIPKSPLGAETFFDMPPTPESDWYTDFDTRIIGDEMAHSIHTGSIGGAPRTPLKKMRKVMRNVFPPMSPRHARVARSTPKSGTAPTHFSENQWLQ